MEPQQAAPREMTVEEWAELDEDVEGELVDGRLEEEEMANYAHELAVAWLASVLRAWLVPLRGFVLTSETKLRIGPKRGRKPDLVLYFAGTPRPKSRAMMGTTPPDVAIEVVTPRPRDARRDRIDKRADYASVGVRHYWILDPELRSLEVYSLGADGRYVDALSVAEGKHAVPGCAGLELDLDALWAEIDAWDEGSSAEET
jgi:Uma2 family endonuclease